MTDSKKNNMCHVCKYRWQQTDGHCYMFREEPPNCMQWKADDRAMQELMQQPESSDE